MAKLLNDVGHGRNTYPPSKGVPGLPEHEFNAAVGREVKSLLVNKLSTYEAQTFGAKDVLLSTRTKLYNAQYKNDPSAIGMSHHANAGNPHVRGFGVFYWHTSSKSKRLAEMVLDEYKKEFPDHEAYPIWGTGLFPSKLNSWTNLHMCRETSAPFVLIEWEFMTNAESLKLLKSEDYRKRCALVAARAACRWYGMSFEESKTAQPAFKTDGKLYRLITGTFATKEQQKAAANQLRKDTGWVVYEINQNGHRLQTGIFTEEVSAEKASTLLKQKFGWLSYIKTEQK